ncbi:MAG: efflux RND transporter permease subunit [Gammaproteobacteria bacterium]
MRHTGLALRRPIATVMIFLAAGLVGLISSQLLPLEEFPDIEFPGIFIQVPYPGSTPEEIERRITRPIEEALSTLSGVDRLRSTTNNGQTQIQLRFDWGSDVSTKGIEARARIDGIRDQLPDDLDNVFIFTGGTADQPIMALRISSDRDLSYEYDLLDRILKRPIERIEGVSKVELQGVDPREVRILLDWSRLTAHQINVQELRDRLQKSNFAVSAGQITADGQRFAVRPMGEFRSLDDIRATPINDSGLMLSDVATVELRIPERNYGRHLHQRYAIGLQVFKSTGANMVDVSDRVMAEVDRVGEDPRMQGISIFTLENSADSVRDSLRDLLTSGLIGGVLAIGVLYLFLRQLTTTLVVTLAVPFSLLITLAALYFAGLSLNILTLMGLMLAVGMLVDNAVVVTENIFRLRQKNPGESFKVTELAVKDVGLAVIAGTATSIIVFAPIMFSRQNDIAVFMTHVAVTISVALVASLVLAQTLIPMLAARVAPPKTAGDGPVIKRLQSGYSASLTWVLRHPWYTAIIILAVVGSVVPAQKMVKFDAFPQESARRMYLPYHVEGSYPLERMKEAVDRIENYLYAHQDELDIHAVYSYYDEENAASTILLTPKEEATRPTKDVIEQIQDEMPEIIIGEPSFSFQQQGGGEGFSIQLSGDSSEQLSALSGEVIRLLGQVDGIINIRKDVGNREQEVRVVVDRDRAAVYGLSVQEIASTISVSMRGQNLREYRGEQGEIDVRLALRDDDQASLEQLAALPLYGTNGVRTELGNVARFELAQGAREIQRINRRTALVIKANLEEVTLDEVKPLVTSILDNYQMPAGYRWKFGEGFDRNDETMQMMGINILMGIVLIFLVMAALFESTLYPISIITSIGFSIIGVFWFFALTNTTFSFMATIGILILIGVVVNNGIVLVDHINNLRWRGLKRDDAIVQAGRDRLRPILMTVATTILGLLPLAVGTTQVGGDGPPYFPMARAIIGGLAFSTLTSLVVVPYVYARVDDMARHWRKALRRAASRLDGAHRK